MKLKNKWLDNNKPVAIIGGTDSGKTNLAIFIGSECSHKRKYLLGYPGKVKGFINIEDKNELFQLKDCVVIIDEFSRYYQRYGRHHNDSLDEALDFAEHRNIKLILTAQNNQAIDRNLESKIKCWALKRINVYTLKNGGMCKVARDSIKHPKVTSASLSLENNEVLWWNIESEIGENGIRTFDNMEVGKDWVVK